MASSEMESLRCKVERKVDDPEAVGPPDPEPAVEPPLSEACSLMVSLAAAWGAAVSAVSTSPDVVMLVVSIDGWEEARKVIDCVSVADLSILNVMSCNVLCCDCSLLLQLVRYG